MWNMFEDLLDLLVFQTCFFRSKLSPEPFYNNIYDISSLEESKNFLGMDDNPCESPQHNATYQQLDNADQNS